MSIYQGSPSPLSPKVSLAAETGIESSLSAMASMAASIGLATTTYGDLLYATKYVGEENVPQDIKRLRRQVYDMMRRMGQPVIIKKMYTIIDVEKGIAEKSPNFDNIYGQVRNNDNLSWGVGFVSREKATDEWINPSTGEIIKADTAPDPSWPLAPKYRGFGPGVVTYLIEPDAPQDYFTLTPTGAMMQVQTAEVSMGWFPKVNDNDLIIHIELNEAGHVIDSGRRYQAKMTTPVSIRGLDRKGRREYEGDFGNRHLVNQNYQITEVPDNHILMKVEIDR
jgi:hypothetical protein